jgi:hypothetical protein
LFLIAGSASARADQTSQKEPAEKEIKRPVYIVPLPVVFYTPETSLAFGGAVLAIRPPAPGLTETGRPNVTRAIAYYTVKNQIQAAVTWEMYPAGDKHRLVLEGYGRKFPDLYYGIGPDTPAQNEEPYTPAELTFEGSFQWKLAPDLYLGPTFLFTRSELVEVVDGGMLDSGGVPGSGGVTVSGLGVRLNYDRRDDVFYPRTGRYAEVETAHFPAWLGSTMAYSRIELDYREYVPLFARSVLAFQFNTEVTGGSVPFQKLPRLGDEDLLRGYRDGRFRDKTAAALQGELRFPVYWRFGGVVFGGVGQVGPSLGELSFDTLKTAGGFGIRYRVSTRTRVNIRLDFAFSPEGSSVYFNFSEAF